jgi:diguanylate cyclase (GGDEF)-like protein
MQPDHADTSLEHRCTASIGVTVFFDSEHAPEDIITRADSAMYQAKEGGRNRVQLYAKVGGG